MFESFQGPLGNVEPITNKTKGPQRVRRAEAPAVEKSGSPVSHTAIKDLLLAAETDKEVNRHETIYPYIDAYKAQGVDLLRWYESHNSTDHAGAIKNAFFENKQHGNAAALGETLPLFANKEGRLGDYLSAKVTKTAKQDDQGNTFIDLIIEVNNKWLATDAPSSMQDIPAKMTFLIDVTTANEGEKAVNKIESFRRKILKAGEKANVKCYKDGLGNLGITRPKIIVSKQPDYMEKVGARLGDCITQTAGDRFVINAPQKFDQEYQAYFLDLVTAIGENAQDNIDYLQSLPPDPKRLILINDYKKIVKFVEAYKKTPTKRTRAV